MGVARAAVAHVVLLGVSLAFIAPSVYGMGSMMNGGMMGRGMMRGYSSPATSAPAASDKDGEVGGALFQRVCSRCHSLPAPQAHSAKQWPSVVERMRLHIRQYTGGDLSNEEVNAIVRYLQRQSDK